jgi:molybdate transport system ATP-binding protein
MTKISAQFFLQKETFILDVNFEIPAPQITIIYGQSGSGKTTLLRCIAGLEQAAKAELVVNGEVWQNSTKNIFLPTHLRKIGYVSQKNSLFPHLSVEENLFFGFKRIEKNQQKIDSKKIIAALKIENLLSRKTDKLSGGETQKIAIARSLLTSPEILLMDEPVSALDDDNKKEILDCIKNLHHQLALPILYVSHSKEETKYLEGEFIFLEKGRIAEK